MLDDYKEKQKVAYNIMMGEIKNTHISHAYLIDENNNSKSFNIVMAFIKEILISGLDSKSGQALCKRIDDGNYPEIKIIEPDGMLIKKQQILDLQQEFSRTAVEGNKRIYIIRDCEKMRPETANSMLKFLEEPDNDLIAILMTNNYNNLLSTIISRCQIIRLSKDDNYLENEELNLIALNFIKALESKGIIVILQLQELLFNSISSKNRDGLIKFFDKMIDIYYNIMKISIDETKSKEIKNYDDLLLISRKYKNIDIIRKINYLIELKDRVRYNVNCNLLIDDLIVSIGG